MSLTTGTYSNYGGQFHFPSGTVLAPMMVLDYPQISMGERNVTNHANGGYEERVPNGLNVAGDFTLSLLETPGVLVTLDTARAAKTVNVCYLKDPVNGMVFSGWIKSVKKEAADATKPDSGKLTVVVTPVGQITIA